MALSPRPRAPPVWYMGTHPAALSDRVGHLAQLTRCACCMQVATHLHPPLAATLPSLHHLPSPSNGPSPPQTTRPRPAFPASPPFPQAPTGLLPRQPSSSAADRYSETFRAQTAGIIPPQSAAATVRKTSGGGGGRKKAERSQAG